MTKNLQKILFDYKERFLTIFIIIGYCTLHIKLTASFIEVTPEKLINFSVPLPYAQRLFIPAIAHFLQYIFPFSSSQIFFFLEVVFVSLLTFSLQTLFNQEFNQKTSKILSLLFLLLLPLITVINYRLPLNQAATFFYPYDTPTLFFLATGIIFCINKNWLLFYITTAIASFNRETALLIVLLVPTLHWNNKKEIFKPFLISLVIYLCIHFFILYFLVHSGGSSIEIYFRDSGFTHFQINIVRFFSGHNWLYFLYSLGFSPLFWFTFYDYIPKYLQPIRYLALFDFLLLLIAGNFVEGRIFSEIFLLLYFPICVGIKNWLTWSDAKIHCETKDNVIVYYLNRYFIIGVLVLTLGMAPLINKVIVWLN